MKLFYNLDTGELLDVNRQLITRWTLRYRDQVALIIAFLRNGDVVEPGGVQIVPTVKLEGEFDSDPICPAVTFTQTGSDDTALWTGTLTVDSPEIEEQLEANADPADDITFFTASIQFYFDADGGKSRSAVTPCDITNSLYRGDETFPVVVAGSGLPALDAFLQRGSAANSTGNTTITLPGGCRIYTVDIVITGAARTSIIVADTTGLTGGEILRLDYTLPATASIILEVRNATTGGTLLDTLTTDDTGDSAFIELTYSGTVWQFNHAQYPAN